MSFILTFFLFFGSNNRLGMIFDDIFSQKDTINKI